MPYKEIMYATISEAELKKLVKNAKIFIEGRKGVETELSYTMKFYSPVNALAGFTDYKDHRDDTLEQVKEMIDGAIEDRQMQNGNYYNIDEKPFDSILVQLKNGGWSAYVNWSDGSECFFVSNMKKSKSK